MKLFRLFTSAALASLAMGTPLRDVILSADSSCQVQGGDEAANLACRVTVFVSPFGDLRYGG